MKKKHNLFKLLLLSGIVFFSNTAVCFGCWQDGNEILEKDTGGIMLSHYYIYISIMLSLRIYSQLLLKPNVKPTERIRQEPPNFTVHLKYKVRCSRERYTENITNCLTFDLKESLQLLKRSSMSWRTSIWWNVHCFCSFFVGTMVLDLSEYFSLLRWWLSRDGLRSALDFQGLEGFPKWADLGRRACYAVEVGTGLLSNQIVQINHNGRKTFPKCKTDQNR